MSRSLHATTIVLAIALGAPAACTHTSGGGKSSSPCDPLAPPSTTLSGILGVGKDAQGTLYVADEPSGASEPRVFVSSGNDLVRQQVTGSGQSGGAKGAGEYTLSFQPPDSDGAAAQALLLDVEGGTATQMARLEGVPRGCRRGCHAAHRRRCARRGRSDRRDVRG